MNDNIKSIAELLGEFLLSNDPLAVRIREAISNKQVEEAEATTPLSDWKDNCDVMNALHISARTLQTMRSNHTIAYSKIQNKIFYRKSDIEKMLEDGMVEKKEEQ